MLRFIHKSVIYHLLSIVFCRRAIPPYRIDIPIILCVYIYILKRFAQSAGPGSGIMLFYEVLCSAVSRFWNSALFWTHFLIRGVSFGVTFCYFIVILGALRLHSLHQEFDWSAKAAKGGAKGQNANIPSLFWKPFWTQFSDIFKTRTTFSMSFRGDVLVMLS